MIDLSIPCRLGIKGMMDIENYLGTFLGSITEICLAYTHIMYIHTYIIYINSFSHIYFYKMLTLIIPCNLSIPSTLRMIFIVS